LLRREEGGYIFEEYCDELAETYIPQIKNRFWDLLGTHVLKLKND